MHLDELKLTLENERSFYKDYLACANRETGTDGRAGSSVSVQRRSVIGRYLTNTGARGHMLDLIELERYFNERYDLCPYGLEPAAVKPKTKNQTAAPTKEDTMSTVNTENKPVVEQVVLVYGKDVRGIPDEQMYGYIAALEAKMNSMLSLKNKPNKLIAQVEEMQKEINMLVAVIDSRG